MEQLVGIFSEAFWYIAPIIVALTTALTEAAKKVFNIDKGDWAQIISWVLASALSIGAWALNFIAFGDPVWLGVVCLCIVTGLSSNGFYDIPVIKAFVEALFGTGKAKRLSA